MKEKQNLNLQYVVLFGVVSLLLTSCVSTPLREPKDGPPINSEHLVQSEDAIPQNLLLARYGNQPTYEVMGKTFTVMQSAENYQERGVASWYGTKFHGRKTSSGEPYDMFAMTAAHKTLPLPTFVRVTNLNNRKSVVVKVNDRGPFHDERLIDLSYSAARKIGVVEHGTAPVEVTVVKPNAPLVDERGEYYIQVGAFSSKVVANKVLNDVREMTQATVFLVQEPRAGLHRVRVGPIFSLIEANRIKEVLSSGDYENSRLITENEANHWKAGGDKSSLAAPKS